MQTRYTNRWLAPLGLAISLALASFTSPTAQERTDSTPSHAQESRRLWLTDAMVIYGNGKPAFGPVDILIENGLIARIGERLIGNPGQRGDDRVIDATGKYVMPGLINTHMHWHEERMPGIPQPIQYERNLYLAAGVTTAREVGGDFAKSKEWRAQSAAHDIVAPRIIVYTRPSLGPQRSPEQIRAGVREAKERGADGLKIGGLDRDQLEALLDEAHLQGLPTTTHIGVEETTARDYVELGVDSIEHFYGIADAALEGIQDFPADMNYNDELHRFARAGELFSQADPEALRAVVESMVEHDVAWSPTLSIYEANRDLIRYQNLPWYDEYLHPSMEEFWKPNPRNHGSYFQNWTNTHEVGWARTYRAWMDALRHFGLKGGLITTGDDAGYIYSLYGFGLVRELELHEEAGFHPLEVLAHATVNGAKLLGLEDRLGKVRQGFIADLLVVNGNPIEDLGILNPYASVNGSDEPGARRGGIEWTIKDGITYHVPTLMAEVREMVAESRAARTLRTTAGR